MKYLLILVVLLSGCVEKQHEKTILEKCAEYLGASLANKKNMVNYCSFPNMKDEVIISITLVDEDT